MARSNFRCFDPEKIDILIIQQAYQTFQNKQRLPLIVSVCLFGMVAANVILDYLFTLYQNSAFYISESLLFSSYWVLYLPLFFLLLKLNRSTENMGSKLAFTGFAIIIHLLVYPALVWLLSKIFYYHTFAYWQTFNFGLSAYFIKSLLIYGFSLPAFTILNKKDNASIISKFKKETQPQHFINSIILNGNNNIKSVLAVNDIFYISANSPYVNIHHLSKKYLHNETLKSLENQLDKKQFIRIHKSHIINLQKIISYQSRQNGDYDVTLSDGTVLRVSRNYAKDFKSKAEQHTHLTTK